MEVDWKDAYRGTGGLTAVRLTATIQTLIYTDGVHSIEGKPTLPLGMGRRRKPLVRDERSNSEKTTIDLVLALLAEPAPRKQKATLAPHHHGHPARSGERPPTEVAASEKGRYAYTTRHS